MKNKYLNTESSNLKTVWGTLKTCLKVKYLLSSTLLGLKSLEQNYASGEHNNERGDTHPNYPLLRTILYVYLARCHCYVIVIAKMFHFQ